MVQLTRKALATIIALLATLTVTAQQTSYRGLALVVANYKYESREDILANPENDCKAVADRLTTLGFKVITAKNLNTQSMLSTLADFGRQAQDYPTAIFYYSGHGAQAEQDEQTCNYMVPVDVTVRNSDDVRKQCIDISYIASQFPSGSKCKQKLFFIDACRNIPTYRIASRGLARNSGGMNGETYDDTWVLFSTAPGSRADDGGGRLSPFATAWLEATDKPGLSLGDVAALIASRVDQLTGGQQQVSLNSDNPPSITLNLSSQHRKENTEHAASTVSDESILAMNIAQLEKAAEKGDARAQLQLAIKYYHGDGTAQNYEKALRWFRESSLLGNSKAFYWLGIMYQKGNGVKRDNNTAEKYFTEGAMRNDPMAQYELGKCYSDGDRNKAIAAKWLNAAAENGDLSLQYLAAKELIAIRYDIPALKWYFRTAEKGNAEAQLFLGHYYFNTHSIHFNGKDINLPVNYSEAAKWFRKAAEQGNKNAMHWYGICLDYGLGVPRDKKAAKEWFNKASE